VPGWTGVSPATPLNIVTGPPAQPVTRAEQEIVFQEIWKLCILWRQYEIHPETTWQFRGPYCYSLSLHVHSSTHVCIWSLIIIYDSTVRLRGMETGISETSKRVSIFSFATQGGKQMSVYFRQGNWVPVREAQIRFPAGWLEFDSIEWSSCARQRASSTIFRYLW
jgi:hypothetical protein